MSDKIIKHDIKDINLADQGNLRADWASREMPVLKSIKSRFLKEKPLKGKKISGCLHITAETANLVETLVAGGAEVFMCASNPLSTQDDIAAYLVSQGISVYAIKGESEEIYDDHLEAVLEEKPHITIDDGADLVAKLHSSNHVGLENMIGSMEETTTGIIRLRALSEEGKLKFPVISVNDSDKLDMIPIARDLSELGFKIIATKGTAEALSGNGISCDTIFKVGEGRPNIVDCIKNDDVQMIINTPLGAQSRYDEYEIGKAAIKHNVHVVTTISGAQAILRGIRMIKNKNLNYMSLQKIFKN